jgi:hypothetical protein
MGERSFVESSKDYYETRAKAEGYGKPELVIDKTRLIPFVSFYLSSIAIVLSVVAIVLVVGGN